MKPDEVRNMTSDEIKERLEQLREQLFKARAEMVTGRVERPGIFSSLRRDIARCLTILKEKENGAETS